MGADETGQLGASLRTNRLLAVAISLAVAAGAAQAAQGQPSAAHPCTLISSRDVARIIGHGGHVEVGGSTCRLHRGKPFVGVITINPETRASFLAFRRRIFKNPSGTVKDVGGTGERAYQRIYATSYHPFVYHNLFAFVNGHHLVITSHKGFFTAGHARRIAKIVARGI
jgi:hypothetical protein